MKTNWSNEFWSYKVDINHIQTSAKIVFVFIGCSLSVNALCDDRRCELLSATDMVVEIADAFKHRLETNSNVLVDAELSRYDARSLFVQ